MKNSFTIYGLLIFSFLQTTFNFYIPFGNHNNVTLNNFSFGSCFGGFLSTGKTWIFKTVLKYDPQIWVWGGDAAYLDSFSLNYFKRSLALNFTHAENMFNKTKNDEFYSQTHVCHYLR